ncbi:hypothetical protein LJC32_00340 [Oscillospiraceae bacterium OttesenSCG-928-F05]|nr:hypothetical protein [Oscillospiraceae bacterium OttesenSCG-928-F05]
MCNICDLFRRRDHGCCKAPTRSCIPNTLFINEPARPACETMNFNVAVTPAKAEKQHGGCGCGCGCGCKCGCKRTCGCGQKPSCGCGGAFESYDYNWAREECLKY